MKYLIWLKTNIKIVVHNLFKSICFSKSRFTLVNNDFSNYSFNVSVKLFECNVPKNTSYFIGSNQDIAVKQLLYVKRIKL